MIWQMVWLVLTSVSLGLSIEQHGKPKSGKENGVAGFIAFLLVHFILYMGGWYS